MTRGRDEMIREMCIAEVTAAAGLSATRETRQYAACAGPTLDPASDHGLDTTPPTG
jgi:hypothetical protein